MKKEDLFRAIGNVEDSMIEEAEKPMKKSRKKYLQPAVAACLALGLVGILWVNHGWRAGASDSAVSNGYGVPSATMAATSGSYKGEYSEEMPEGSFIAGSGMGSSDSIKLQDSDRKLVYTAFTEMETKEYDTALQKLLACIDSYGGYLESSNENGNAEYHDRVFRATVRVPSEQYSAFLTATQDVATVLTRNQSVTDITLEYVDTAARVQSLRTQQQRLNELMEQAGNLSDLLEIQNQLSYVEYELESYESSLRVLDKKVSMSTVTINLNEVHTVTPVTNTYARRLLRALRWGWDDLGDFFLMLAEGWPVVLVVIVGGTAWIVHKKKKR